METYLLSIPLTRHRRIVPARLDEAREYSERSLMEEPSKEAAPVLEEWTPAARLDDRSSGT
jgi:hypothetical protein